METKTYHTIDKSSWGLGPWTEIASLAAQLKTLRETLNGIW